ncbi:MAG: hypothetical protein ACRD4B_10665 [Acidobacteriota bacterium]
MFNMPRKGFTCQKCGYGCGFEAAIDFTYEKEFTKPSEEDEEKMIQAALQDSRYDRFRKTEKGKLTIDFEKLNDEDKALDEELYLHSRYNLELSPVETAYLSNETKFVEEYGTCPNCNTKGELRETT